MSAHSNLECLLIEPIAEPDNILLGVTLNPAISLVNINGRARTGLYDKKPYLLVKSEPQKLQWLLNDTQNQF